MVVYASCVFWIDGGSSLPESGRHRAHMLWPDAQVWLHDCFREMAVSRSLAFSTPTVLTALYESCRRGPNRILPKSQFLGYMTCSDGVALHILLQIPHCPQLCLCRVSLI